MRPRLEHFELLAPRHAEAGTRQPAGKFEAPVGCATGASSFLDFMSLHKLHADLEPRDGNPAAVQISLTSELWDLAGSVIRARAVRAIDLASRSLPIYRLLRWSVHRKVGELFDALCGDAAFSAQRIDAGSALLTGPGLFVAAEGHDKGSYCSCVFQVWADGRGRAEEAEQRIKAVAGAQRPRDQSFVLDWHFLTRHGLRSSSFEEIVSDTLLDEAYPALGGGVDAFVAGYLASPESVLILLGPPGGGKTRLVRQILAAMTRRKGENVEVLYTTDKRVLGSDELFVDFITSKHEALVVEDTDHMLKPRTSGNEDMHRFLAVADGIARAQGRKMIFTTNLPNVSDIDPALTRPGRCFAVKLVRSLEPAEARRLAARICGADEARAARAFATIEAAAAKSYTVAQVYRACA